MCLLLFYYPRTCRLLIYSPSKNYLVIFNSNNIFRTLRQNPNDKRADLSEEIPLYTSSKGLCDTSVYSEIPENKNSQVCVYA